MEVYLHKPSLFTAWRSHKFAFTFTDITLLVHNCYTFSVNIYTGKYCSLDACRTTRITDVSEKLPHGHGALTKRKFKNSKLELTGSWNAAP